MYRVYHETVSERQTLLLPPHPFPVRVYVYAYGRAHRSATDSKYEYETRTRARKVTTTCVRLVCVRNTEDERVSLERPGRTERWGVRQARVVAGGTISPHPEEPRFGFPTLVARPTPPLPHPPHGSVRSSTLSRPVPYSRLDPGIPRTSR